MCQTNLSLEPLSKALCPLSMEVKNTCVPFNSCGSVITSVPISRSNLNLKSIQTPYSCPLDSKRYFLLEPDNREINAATPTIIPPNKSTSSTSLLFFCTG